MTMTVTQQELTCKTNTKMVKKRKVRARAPGMTQISISLPEGLVGKIDEMADAENRNRSNFIATVLESLAGERGVKAAESSKRFG
ncbi:MAG TPA: ribbon-helix-helix domain-containing protein [Opitutales bacterium]|nr:ribbon-helix-helix domain-containing protein [Opitutales bacterium]